LMSKLDTQTGGDTRNPPFRLVCYEKGGGIFVAQLDRHFSAARHAHGAGAVCTAPAA
jgi:hypothetical protein